MTQAAHGYQFGEGYGDLGVPTRYVFDEGHHVFDAADSAFSAVLSGQETAELRRWLLGAEGSRSRARGLRARLEDLVAGLGGSAEPSRCRAQGCPVSARPRLDAPSGASRPAARRRRSRQAKSDRSAARASSDPIAGPCVRGERPVRRIGERDRAGFRGNRQRGQPARNGADSPDRAIAFAPSWSSGPARHGSAGTGQCAAESHRGYMSFARAPRAGAACRLAIDAGRPRAAASGVRFEA